MGVSLATNESDEQCGNGFGLRLGLGGELLEQEEDNTGAAEGKREAEVGVTERFEEQGEIVIRLRARSAVNMRVIRGQLLAYRSHLPEEFVVFDEYALDLLKSKRPVEVLEL